MNKEPERQDVFASKWGDVGPNTRASVHCWMALDGKVTSLSYNLSDSTGDHNLLRPRKSDQPYIKGLKALAEQAKVEAREIIAYKAARRRDTEFSNFRFAFLVTEGRGGHTVYVDEAPDSSCHISGYGLTKEELAEIDRLGIPFVDTRTIPDHLITRTIGHPMYPQKPSKYDPAPWSSMSFAPVEVVAWLEYNLGAIVKNMVVREPKPEELRDAKKWEIKALTSWVGNDEAGVGEAMAMMREEESR